MSESFQLIIQNLNPAIIAIIVLGIIAVLYLLPQVVQGTGLKKIGPIQLEQENQTLNHLTNKRIEAIDIENRENLWEATEEYIQQCAMESKIRCVALVNSILAAITSPIKTMILLNHIAPKLVFENEQQIIEKLKRAIARGLREINNAIKPETCTEASLEEMQSLKDYSNFFPAWLKIAREITVKACFEKVKIYEEALEQTRDKHWTKIFQSCLDKNISYIEGMGYIINKQNKLEKV